MRTRLLISLLGLLLAIGCTTTSEGTPLPVSDSTRTASPEDPPKGSTPADEPQSENEVPQVKAPLDISRFFNDPCQALTPNQAEELNVPTEGKVSDGPLGKVCDWRNPETRGATGIRMRDKNRVGLRALYEANERGEYAYFDEIPSIEGFPAISYDISDERDRGICTVSVGVSNDLTFAVSLQLSTANVDELDPCEKAAIVAGMMVRTMKGES